jgi:hypothetical protein
VDEYIAAPARRMLIPTQMAEIEIGPLADRLTDDELKDLAAKLEKLGVPKFEADQDSDATAVASVDGDVLVEFLDRLDGYDLACDIYLPLEFDGRVEVGDHTVGSAAALVEILEEMKDDLAPEDEDDDDEDDVDDDEDADDDYSDMKLIEEKLRRLWKVIYDGAQAALSRGLPLYVLAD